jgi:signal transduction histidine kinase
MRPNSIRARMTIGFALFIAALMLAVCAAFFIYNKRRDRQNADVALAQAAREIQSELGGELAPDGGKSASGDAAGLIREESASLRARHLAMLVVDARGRVVAQSPLHAEGAPSWPLRSDSWRTTSFPAREYTIVLAAPWHAVEQELRERTLLLLGLSTLVVVAAAAGAWVLVGRTLAPIDQLARQAQAAATDTLHVRLNAPSPDAEIERLVATLNALLARLVATAAARERFYAAASHELRTPLQALSGHLEVALSRRREAGEYAAALEEARAQAERLTSLVQDLLLHTQLDAGTTRPPAAALDLADLCETELARLRPLAAERGLRLELELPDDCELSAPWNHAAMLLRNLLENAVKYATPGGTVRVQLSGSTLSVYNDCKLADGWEPDRYFEPFFRPDAARNSQTGGNGLGLAICKAIALANDWTLALQEEDGGISATVNFEGPHA